MIKPHKKGGGQGSIGSLAEYYEKNLIKLDNFSLLSM